MTHDPARPWPRTERLASGRLELSFDAPLGEERRADWLRVRDWLTREAGAIFTSAYEYPTFEWYARMTVPNDAAGAELRLWWADYPHELTLSAEAPDGDAIIERLGAALRERRPDLGSLREMNHDKWRAWMTSLGAPGYE